MKFTKEDAVKELAAQLSKKVEKIDEWDRTIKEHVENLMSLVGEGYDGELSDFVQKAMPLFDTTAGFIRKTNADVAKGLNEKITELEKKINPKPTPPKEGGDNKEYLERLERLEQEIANERKSKEISEKRSLLMSKIGEGGVKNKEWISTIVGKISIDENTDIEKEARDYVEMYNKFFSQIPDDYATPKEPSGNPSQKTNETIKAAAEIAKRNRL